MIIPNAKRIKNYIKVNRFLKNLIPNKIKFFFKKLYKFFLYKLRKYYLMLVVRFSKRDLKIILGAALTRQKNWFSTNEEWLDITSSNDWEKVFLKKNTISNLLAEHVFEHLTAYEMRKALLNIYDYLRPNGIIRIAVPDGNNPNEEYIKNVGISGKGADAEDHKQLIKYETLRDEMKRIGFKVRLKEGYDKKGVLKSTKIDKDNGMITRSRYTNSAKKKYLKGIKGWEYKDSVSSLIIDGEKI